MRVYDLANAGPRRRFTVLTDDGPVVVHNCHLALGYSMGADKFVNTARLNRLTVGADEAQSTVQLYRSTFFKVPEFWRRAGNALASVRSGASVAVDPGGFITTDKDRLIKPSGMPILYDNLRQETDGSWVYNGYDEDSGKPMPKYVYGGKVVENIVQSVARDIICEQMIEIAHKYRVVMQVHDEIVCHVPRKQADQCMEDMVRIMSTSPTWLPGIPLAAEADWSYRYGDCK